MSDSVFLSYSRADRAYAEKLANHLQASGIKVWWDFELAAGSVWAREVQRRIDECTTFLLVLTPDSVASEWVYRELHHAVDSEKPIVPLLLKSCVAPLPIAGLHREDVRDGSLPGERLLNKLRGDSLPAPHSQDIDTPGDSLRTLAHWFRETDPSGTLMQVGIRSAFARIIDGPHTGRYRYAQLDKFEKTYLDGHVEKAIGDVFKLEIGTNSDRRLHGLELNIRFSARYGGWMIPQDAREKFTLFIYADEERGHYGAGLCHTSPTVLSGGANRDGKQRISRDALHGEEYIWLAKEAPFPKNIYLRLAPEAVQSILGKREGIARVTELIRQSCGQIITVDDVSTAALESDGLRRLRDAREILAREGIRILSSRNHRDQQVAQALGLPLLTRDQIAVVRADATDESLDRRGQAPGKP